MRLRVRDDAPGLLHVESAPIKRWQQRLGSLVLLTGVLAFAAVPSAVADGDHWWCKIPMVCQAKEAVDFASNPLGYLAQKLAEANVWFLGKLLDLVQHTSQIDLTDENFVKQYALIFAASTVLTVALWLAAVAKRAIRGVSLGTAVGEAVGFLVLQFVVNALAPGAIALLIKAVDEITRVFAPGATENFKPFLSALIKSSAAQGDQGAVTLGVVDLVMLLGALLMWVELLMRSAAIYVAVALGPLVNTGLVDRDLWGKTKKWAGAIVAIALSKPVLFTLLGLGGTIVSSHTVSGNDAASKVFSGGLILLLATFASAVLYKWIPAFGDEMADLHHARKTASSSGPAAAVDGPASHMNRAMSHHTQNSLVGRGGGQGPGHPTRTAAGGAARTAQSAGGSGSAPGGAAGSGGVAGVGGAAASPAGAAAAGVKAGVNLTKNKATSSPGAQGTQAGQPSGAGQPGGNQADAAPARARPPQGGGGPSVVNGQHSSGRSSQDQ